MKKLLWRVENIMGKGKYVGYQHFLPFSEMFSKIVNVVKTVNDSF